MTTPADALEVMAIVVACHHRTAPRMDDREAALATAKIWAELFDEYGFTTAELIAAVKKRAKTCPDAPEAADIIRVARATRTDRLEREPDTLRDARQGQIDARVAEHMAEITAALDARFDRPSLRHSTNPLAVRCPWCRARPGRHCTVPQTKDRPAGGAHPSRIEAAEEALAAQLKRKQDEREGAPK